MIREDAKIFKIRKDLTKLLEVDKIFKRKIIKLKKSIQKKNENKLKDFYCIFNNCGKVFPNYTRWMLHYKMHVYIF